MKKQKQKSWYDQLWSAVDKFSRLVQPKTIVVFEDKDFKVTKGRLSREATLAAKNVAALLPASFMWTYPDRPNISRSFINVIMAA